MAGGFARLHQSIFGSLSLGQKMAVWSLANFPVLEKLTNKWDGMGLRFEHFSCAKSAEPSSEFDRVSRTVNNDWK